MEEKSIERVMRQEFPSELPYGFAERVARAVLGERATATVWDFLLRLTPSTGLALGGAVAVLLIMSFTGSGPGVLESVTHYDSYSTFISLP